MRLRYWVKTGGMSVSGLKPRSSRWWRVPSHTNCSGTPPSASPSSTLASAAATARSAATSSAKYSLVATTRTAGAPADYGPATTSASMLAGSPIRASRPLPRADLGVPYSVRCVLAAPKSWGVNT